MTDGRGKMGDGAELDFEAFARDVSSAAAKHGVRLAMDPDSERMPMAMAASRGKPFGAPDWDLAGWEEDHLLDADFALESLRTEEGIVEKWGGSVDAEASVICAPSGFPQSRDCDWGREKPTDWSPCRRYWLCAETRTGLMRGAAKLLMENAVYPGLRGMDMPMESEMREFTGWHVCFEGFVHRIECAKADLGSPQREWEPRGKLPLRGGMERWAWTGTAEMHAEAEREGRPIPVTLSTPQEIGRREIREMEEYNDAEMKELEDMVRRAAEFRAGPESRGGEMGSLYAKGRALFRRVAESDRLQAWSFGDYRHDPVRKAEKMGHAKDSPGCLAVMAGFYDAADVHFEGCPWGCSM